MIVSKVILNKTYWDETLIDLESNVWDAINKSNIPKNDDGFHKTSFEVTIKWVSENG